MIGECKYDHIYLAAGYTDLRCGVSGLASIIQNGFHMEPCSNNLYLFCGRRADRIKQLYWAGTGFVLVYHRLEQGRFQWPRSPEEVRELTEQQYRWLMEGLKLDQKQALKPLEGAHVV